MGFGGVIQYKYSLFRCETEPEKGIVDEKGNFEPPTEKEFVFICNCRDEQNSSGAIINLMDGKAFQYSSLIQLPFGSPVLKEGDLIQVRDTDGNIRVQGMVMLFRKDQLHNRAWI